MVVFFSHFKVGHINLGPVAVIAHNQTPGQICIYQHWHVRMSLLYLVQFRHLFGSLADSALAVKTKKLAELWNQMRVIHISSFWNGLWTNSKVSQSLRDRHTFPTCVCNTKVASMNFDPVLTAEFDWSNIESIWSIHKRIVQLLQPLNLCKSGTKKLRNLQSTFKGWNTP